ncbi:MAG: type I restriction enzyme HsdR N-terminal domain-containing protein, partial [Bacteroidales bacterium]|nr:type I restriction enzyme HsdR N-terminal domain-containing protein [Bacteroidales bacterium]
LVECKAPEVGISKDTFLQILRYNVALKVTYLLLTNGLDTFMAKIETKTGEYTFLTSIPEYNEISK